MTVTQAIDFIRNLLDEPKYEYFGSSTDLTTIFTDALREASTIIARECWHRGEKEALRPVWFEVQLPLNANQTAQMPVRFLFIESVRSNFADGNDKLWPHKYVSPAIFSRRRNRTPMEPSVGTQLSRSSIYYTRAEYTIVGDNIMATSNTIIATPNKNVTVSYIAVPTIPVNFANQLPLAQYMHPVICDKAAEILYRKEHPGDDRPSVGGILDIEAALYKVMREGVA